MRGWGLEGFVYLMIIVSNARIIFQLFWSCCFLFVFFKFHLSFSTFFLHLNWNRVLEVTTFHFWNHSVPSACFRGLSPSFRACATTYFVQYRYRWKQMYHADFHYWWRLALCVCVCVYVCVCVCVRVCKVILIVIKYGSEMVPSQLNNVYGLEWLSN